MSLVGYKGQNHPQQTGKRGPNREVDDRATTPEMFAEINARLGPFTLDVAAAAHNTKCERYYSIEDNGLEQAWNAPRVWCNPPYSDIRPWVEKARDEFGRGRRSAKREHEAGQQWIHGHRGPDVIAMLLPANRTEQGWWQDLVEPHRDRGGPLRVEFLRGRPRFIRAGSIEVGPNERPPFGCCLLIWSAA